jgi:hypothetical protein
MKQKSIFNLVIPLFTLIVLASCSGDNASDNTDTPSTIAVPSVYAKIYGATSITNDGTYITIKSTGLPDHKSVYYPTGNALYENFTGTTFGGFTFKKNPNTITARTYTFKIPVNPKVSATHAATPLGAM